MVDTMMVSHAGEAAISGVALVDMIDYLIITIFAALATGGAVIVSQYLGSRQKVQANNSAGQLITVLFFLSVMIMILCLVFHESILKLLFGKIEADVMKACVTYFVITACSFPFLGAYNASAALFRSMQKTNITMYISALMNIINIVGNAIGIFVFKAGVAGVAVPTLISRAFAAVLMTALLFRKQYEVHLTYRAIFSLKKEVVKSILRIAVPNGLENGCFALGRVLVTGIVLYSAQRRLRQTCGKQHRSSRCDGCQRHQSCHDYSRRTVYRRRRNRTVETVHKKADENILHCNSDLRNRHLSNSSADSAVL